MVETRRVAKYDGTGAFFVAEEPIPDLEAGEVLLDVATAGVSAGTQGRHVRYKRENPDPDASPSTTGYQAAGRVAATGPGVTRFEPGDRIAAMGSGYAIQASHDVVPVNLCTSLPESVSFEAGAYIHLATTALNGVRRAEPEPGAYMAVLGLGIVGQLTAQEAYNAGCAVLGSDLYDLRREKAAEFGTEALHSTEDSDLSTVAAEFTDGSGLDGGIMCFGGDGTEALHDLLAGMKQAPDGETLGEIILTGGVEVTISGGASLGNVDVRGASRTGPGYHDPNFERGDDYPEGYVRWTTPDNLETVTRWLETDRLAIEPLITHTYSLDDVNQAYDTVIENPEEYVGIVIESDVAEY